MDALTDMMKKENEILKEENKIIIEKIKNVESRISRLKNIVRNNVIVSGLEIKADNKQELVRGFQQFL